MNESFECGSLVRLKSGSVTMVVQSIDDHGFIWCKWHDKEQKPCSDYYRPAMLTSAIE